MSRKVIAVIIALALAIGTSVMVSADESTKTSGDIKFKAGEVIIIPPGESEEDIGGDLWFGEHELRALKDDVNNTPWGRESGFNSRMHTDSGGNPILAKGGEYTGIDVICADTNREIRVSIGGFYMAGTSTETLKGFTLELIPRGLITSNADTVKGVQPAGVGLRAKIDGTQGDALKVLECQNAGQYWATWYGNLGILADTAIAKGEAQAVLNWTVFNA